jgi:ABC-type sugar transport system substrate-binding protein
MSSLIYSSINKLHHSVKKSSRRKHQESPSMRNLSFAGALTLLFASSSLYVRAADIDFGPYCSPEAKEALTPKAAPDSITGKVGFAVASLTFPYGVALKNRTEEAAKKYFPHMELQVGDGRNDPSVQSAVVDNFIVQGVKVLIINAVEKDALAPAVKRAVKAGIKVIEIDRTVSTPVLTTTVTKENVKQFNGTTY